MSPTGVESVEPLALVAGPDSVRPDSAVFGTRATNSAVRVSHLVVEAVTTWQGLTLS